MHRGRHPNSIFCALCRFAKGYVAMCTPNPFKATWALERRVADSSRIRQRYPDRVPVIVQPYARKVLRGVDPITTLSRERFLVPADLTTGQLMQVVRKMLPRLASEGGLFLCTASGAFPSTTQTMRALYDAHADAEDGFLYIFFMSENVFGARGRQAASFFLDMAADKSRKRAGPKAALLFLQCIVDAGDEDAALAAQAKSLFERRFAAWKDTSDRAKAEEQGAAGGKRKYDPVASSIGAAVKKMAKLPIDEQHARLESMEADLRERVPSASEDADAGSLPRSIAAKVVRAVGAKSTAEHIEAATRANEALVGAANELHVPRDHTLRKAANTLFALASTAPALGAH